MYGRTQIGEVLTYACLITFLRTHLVLQPAPQLAPQLSSQPASKLAQPCSSR